MSKRVKQVWTKRCPSNRHNRPDGFNAAPFMPDEYDICDDCLMDEYGLVAGYDACDQLGLGPEHIEKESVIIALRRARREANAGEGENG